MSKHYFSLLLFWSNIILLLCSHLCCANKAFESQLLITLKEKLSHFDLKSWVLTELKFYQWPSISSQFDSNILQLLEIQGRILVPPVTQLFRSKWLHFFFQWINWFRFAPSGANPILCFQYYISHRGIYCKGGGINGEGNKREKGGNNTCMAWRVNELNSFWPELLFPPIFEI